MNNVIQSLTTRRSVKKYTTQMPDEAQLQQILEAGMYAPTGRGLQSPLIIAVTNKALRDRLSRMNARILGTDADPFYGAPVVLVVLAERNNPTHIYDGSLVMGNLLNAAHALGLGACWIHRAKEEFDSEEGRDILRQLGIEGDYEGIGHCIVGYPAGEMPATRVPRKEDYVVWAK